MTKRQLIDEIITRNRSAQPSFLARFDAQDLQDYLDHLCVTTQPRLRGDPNRYDKYFQVSPIAATSATPQQDIETPEADVFFRAERDDASATARASAGYGELTDLAEPDVEEALTDAEVDVDAEEPDNHLLIQQEPTIRWREPEGSSPVGVAQPSADNCDQNSAPEAPKPSGPAASPQTQARPPAGAPDEDTESWLF